MTFPEAAEYGRCPCSGSYEPRRVQVTMSVRDQRVALDDVSQGACPVCGSRVYKSGVLQVVEALMRDEPVGPDGRTSTGPPPTPGEGTTDSAG